MADRPRRVLADDSALYEIQSSREEYESRKDRAPIFRAGKVTDVKSSNYAAAEDELVVCDPTGAAFTVTLPSLPRDRIGASVTVANASASTNAITVQVGDGGDSIEGSASQAMSTAWQVVMFTKVTSTIWVSW